MNKLFPADKPYQDLWPKAWKDTLPYENTYIAHFRNLQHFKNYCESVKQKESHKCGIPYDKALKELLTNTPTMTADDYEIIKNKVKQVLLKRGLISDTIYHSYEYTVDGQGSVDVARFAAGMPDCILTPSNPEQQFFYEIYVSISYEWSVSDDTIKENMAKLLATIELLEREHY